MKALIFDTETTGLVKNSLIPLDRQPRMIEFYGQIVDTETCEVIEDYHSLVNPGFEISEEITKITGIKPEDLQGQPVFPFIDGNIRGIIGKADAIIAHNLSYDWSILNFEFERSGTIDKVKWPIRRICTVEETEWMCGYRLSLSALYEYLFNETFAGAHRAKADVEALTKCVLELVRRGDL